MEFKKSKILLKEIYDGLLTRKKEVSYYTAFFIYEEVFDEES